MTNVEFQEKLRQMYKDHPIIGVSERKTINELLYMLRMDDSVTDYNVNIKEGKAWGCIPSVKECFVPVRTLAKHVTKVECDEEDYGFDGLCLTVYVED